MSNNGEGVSNNSEFELEPGHWEIFSFVLYIFLITEIIVFFVIFEFIIASVLLIFLIGLLWMRRVLVTEEPSFHKFKTIIAKLLDQSSSIEDNYNISSIKPSLDLDKDRITSLQSGESDNIIADLRSIGLDGILILLFLTKNQENLCSIKTIQSDLGIPFATLYRNMNNLEEYGLIKRHSLLEEPGKKYYQVSEFGLSNVKDLYKIVTELNHTSL